jgi:hypothetical protein
MNRSVSVDTGRAKYLQDVSIGPHALQVDEPVHRTLAVGLQVVVREPA